MEKKGILVILFIFSFILSQAQDSFIKRDLLVNGSLYLFNYKNPRYAFSERAGRSVPFSLSAEYGISQYVSVGIVAGYYLKRFRYTANTSEPSDDIFFNSKYFVPGLKASLHLTPLLENKFNTELQSEDLDLYVSALLGYEFNSITRDNVPAIEKSRLAPGLVVGARYYLTERWAVFGEVGPGIFGFGSMGVTARF